MSKLDIGSGDRKPLNVCLPSKQSLQDTEKYAKEALLIWLIGLCVWKSIARKEIGTSSPSASLMKSIFENLCKAWVKCLGLFRSFLLFTSSGILSSMENPGL